MSKDSKPTEHTVYHELFPHLTLDNEAIELLDTLGVELEYGESKTIDIDAIEVGKKFYQLYTSQITQPREGLK